MKKAQKIMKKRKKDRRKESEDDGGRRFIQRRDVKSEIIKKPSKAFKGDDWGKFMNDTIRRALKRGGFDKKEN